jgi:hypothetical protein
LPYLILHRCIRRLWWWVAMRDGLISRRDKEKEKEREW